MIVLSFGLFLFSMIAYLVLGMFANQDDRKLVNSQAYTRPKKYWGKVVEIESWSWDSVSYWIEEIDDKGKIINREPEYKWKQKNPNGVPDFEVIIRNVE